jgi:outer membrane lipoprotein LolB
MKRRTAVALLGLLLGACTSLPPRERPARFWSGRIGLLVQSDPPQHLQASFELQGTPISGELTLLSPIGSTLARLSWNPQQAMLERGAERWSGANVSQLAQQLAQTPLPVEALFDWIAGRPVPHAGWEADLGALDQGRIVARRQQPAPPALLRIVLDQ